MMTHATNLANQLTEETVLGEWFNPMDRALDKIRFSDAIFASLPMRAFILFGCLRQIQSIPTLRETIQNLFHMDECAAKPPVPRSTMSDALSSACRRDILLEALGQLIRQANHRLPDKLAGVEGLGDRPVIAIDATYQEESCHYYPVTPSQGGTDNKKGHQHLTHYDMRLGIPMLNLVETASIAEIRLLKEGMRPEELNCMNLPWAIHVVDRAFVDAPFWDMKKSKLNSTIITRMKSNLNYSVGEHRAVLKKRCNQGIVSDHIINLESSNQTWRLIEFVDEDAQRYQYLTNDLDLEPGVVAFLYHRRWDLEKYFDNFKNDMANAKAWGKRREAIEQQALMGMMSYILMRLFIEKKYRDLGLTQGDTTQRNKHRTKQENYVKHNIGIAYRVYYESLSMVTRQMWRFIKNCFHKKSSPRLYERQFKPLLERYL